MTTEHVPDSPGDGAVPAPSAPHDATVSGAAIRAASPDQRPPRPRRRRAFAGGAVALALLVAVALSIALLAHARGHTSDAGAGTSTGRLTTSIPAGWHWYHESDGYFSVAVPDGWTATRSTSVGTYENSTGSDAVTMTMIELGGPPNGTKTITVQINVQPIDTFLRRMDCQHLATPYVNAKVAGLPATYLPNAGWLLTTNAASFQINYFYPGYTGDTLQTTTPTPIPQAALTQGQHEMAVILRTFRPIPDTPFTCS